MFKEIPATKRSLKRRNLIHGIGINDAAYQVVFEYLGKKYQCPWIL